MRDEAGRGGAGRRGAGRGPRGDVVCETLEGREWPSSSVLQRPEVRQLLTRLALTEWRCSGDQRYLVSLGGLVAWRTAL